MLNLFRLVLVTLDQDICRFFKDREDQTKIYSTELDSFAVIYLSYLAISATEQGTDSKPFFD